MVAHPAQHALVEPAQEVELAILKPRRDFARARCWPRRGRWLEDRALVRGRQEAAAEAIDAPGRDQAAIEHDEPGQVLALACPGRRSPRRRGWAGPGVRCRYAGSNWRLVCSEKFETTDRMIARSSTCVATWGKRSLTGMPLSPYWRNFQGLLSTLPTLLNWVGWVLTLIGWPCSRSSRGLGSNVSTWDGPPSMYRKMTLRARAGKWPGLAARGLVLRLRSAAEAAAAPSLSRPVPLRSRRRKPARGSSAASAIAPKPLAHRRSMSRRVRGARAKWRQCMECRVRSTIRGSIAVLINRCK